jgi:hypothetical protein
MDRCTSYSLFCLLFLLFFGGFISTFFLYSLFAYFFIFYGEKIGRLLFNVASGQEQEQPPEIREPNKQRSGKGDHLAVRWKWQWGDDIYSTGARDFPMEALRTRYTGRDLNHNVNNKPPST